MKQQRVINVGHRCMGIDKYTFNLEYNLANNLIEKIDLISNALLMEYLLRGNRSDAGILDLLNQILNFCAL